jgi:hypothetical protein
VNGVPVRRITPHSDPARIPELCDRILKDFLTQSRKGAKGI